jgi:hypothetical protein
LLIVTAAGSVAFSVRVAQEEAKAKKALENEKKAFENEQREAQEAKEQRDRAQLSFQQARSAVDFFAQIGEDLPNTPALQGVRRRMLEEALRYYGDFSDDHKDDPKLKAELAESYARISKILGELGKKPDAFAMADKARLMHEQLLRTNPSEDLQRRLFSNEQQLFSLQGCGQLTLLTNKVVREELQLSEKQIEQINELPTILTEQRRRLREFPPSTPEERNKAMDTLAQDNKRRMANILSVDQANRLKELSLRVRGSKVFREKEVPDALNLTPAQRDKVEEILRDWSPSARRRSEDRPRTLDRILATLTEEQLAQWNELIGKPPKEEIRLGPTDGMDLRRGGNSGRPPG